ncbi:MAG TPA: tyrosine-type recombinase/integrase, partial [Gaiellaceae bacterium]|nr:tyrosine-type recombinase/integrase [Gaiellaceae bacterium]
MPVKRNGKLPKGIIERHARNCSITKGGQKCSAGEVCKGPTYQAQVRDRRTGRRERKSFATVQEAKDWRTETLLAIRRREHQTEAQLSLRAAWEDWYAGATASPPTVRPRRSAQPFKPSVLRGYEMHMRTHVLPELGGRRLREITRVDLARLAERLQGEGLAPGTIANAIMPLRALYRRAVNLGLVRVNPTTGLDLPGGAVNPRERAASPEEARELLSALPEDVRVVFATAFYAGLRVGEIQALRWQDVNLADGTIHVRRAWDEREGAIEPKSNAGRRRVPIIGLLRD